MKNKWFLWGERVVGKVERITERIIENEQEVKELLSKQSIEDLYEFFLSKDSTLTAKEFDDEVYDILEYYSKNISESLEELEEIETKQIAGGKSDFIKKSLSASLCALTLNSGINVSASPVSVNSSSQNAVSILENKNQQDSLTFGEKIKAWAIKNKKALIITGITVAVIAGIIIAVVVYKNKNSVSGTGTPPAQVLNLVDNTENKERPDNHEESAALSATQSKNESGKETSVTSAPAAQSKNESGQKTSAKPVEGQTENSTGQKSSGDSNENRARGQSTTALAAAKPEGKPGPQGTPAKPTSVQTGNSKQTPVSVAPVTQSGNRVKLAALSAANPSDKSVQKTSAKPTSGQTENSTGQKSSVASNENRARGQSTTALAAAKPEGKPGPQGILAKPTSVQTGNSKQTPVSAAPAAQSENNTGQKTPTTTAAAKPPEEHKDKQQKATGKSKIQRGERVKRLKENLDGKILFVSPGGRPKTQSVVAGPTGSAADASGGRPKVQAAAAGGSTKDSANAFGGGPGSQSAAAGSTAADARYTPSTTGNNLREAEKAMKNVHVGRLRAIFGQQDSPKSPTGGLNSEQNATLIKASVEAAKKNFMVEFFKVKQNIEVHSEEFNGKMGTLESLCKKGENKDWLFDQVNGALQSLNQDLVNMRKLQTQMGKGYLKGVDEEVRKELVNKMDEVSKKVESAKVGLNVVFGEEIKKIENWGKMLDELKTNALYVARDLIRQVTEGE